MWVLPFVSDNLEGSEINIRPTTEFIFSDAPVFSPSANSVRKENGINQFTFACRYLNSNSQHDKGQHLISVSELYADTTVTSLFLLDTRL